MFGIKKRDKKIEELEKEIDDMIREMAALHAQIICADEWKRDYDRFYRGTEKDEWYYKIYSESWDRGVKDLRKRGYLRE